MTGKPAIQEVVCDLLQYEVTIGLHKIVKEVASLSIRTLIFKGTPVALAAMLWLATSAEASTSTYVIPGGTTVGGQPVSATATFVTSTNDLQITLTNLQNNPTSIIQSLSDLAFTLSTGQTVGSLLSSSALERTVNGNGTFTNGSTVSTGWQLETSGSGLRLHVLGTPIGPAHTLIGDSGAGNLYSNAGGSIAGNGPHNPFITGTATFDIQIIGLIASSLVNSATFSFGTTEGANVPGVPRVPGPATLLLLGSGLGIIGFRGWRRRQ
jgi:hypothetical protein